VCARQIDREHGGQRCRTRLHVLDRLVDVEDGRRRAMLTRFELVKGLRGYPETHQQHHAYTYCLPFSQFR